MLVKVKKLDGQKDEFQFDENDTVASVKEQLAEKCGIPAAQIRLIHQGAPMVDSNTLKQHKVVAGSMLHMIVQLR